MVNHRGSQPVKSEAFTLVELLVVVAVIAILAGIAAINFLEAQARSKIARFEADVKTLRAALAAYRVDHSAFPPAAKGDFQLTEPLTPLTTPVAYVTSLPRDPFGLAPFDFAPSIQMLGYNYKDRLTTSVGMPAETYKDLWDEPTLKAYDYIIHSCGPNRVWDVTPYVEYDPTNGTVSLGDISRFGPM